MSDQPTQIVDRIVGDTLSGVLFALTKDGTAVDLTGLTVAGAVYTSATPEAVTATVTAAASGQGYLTLTDNCVSAAGEYPMYVTVTSGGKVDHYPSQNRRWLLRVHEPLEEL